jgi:flagellar hook assembly protein FlgD
MGQRIITIKNEQDQAGYHYSLWNGNDQNGDRVANGIYFLRIVAKAGYGKSSMTRKMIFTKQ